MAPTPAAAAPRLAALACMLLLMCSCSNGRASSQRRQQQQQYTPDWDSIDSRPLPGWFDEAKFGIFIHWGVFSVPSFGNEWFWYNWKNGDPGTVNFMKNNYPPGFTYADFAPQFTAEFYDPAQWADIFQASGARYIVLTSKHHEGYTNWPSKVSFNWNSMDVGPKRDLVGDLAFAIRNRTSLRFGLYHSMFDFYHPLWLQDQANNFTTQYFPFAKALPELYEIVNAYKPEVIWSDGDWLAPDVYWNSTDFLAWLYNESPVKDTVVTNDRWGSNIPCHHGGYYTCTDRYNPGTLQKHKWENCMTIDSGSWGYRRNAQLKDYLTMDDLTQVLAETVSCGGNLLMNVGPTHDGRILPIFEERLRQMGAWLQVNGEAIYNSTPWLMHQNDTVTKDVWFTTKDLGRSSGPSLYAIVLDWPANNQLVLGAVPPVPMMTVTMLGLNGTLSYRPASGKGTAIQFPALSPVELPCQWAWTVKIDGLL